MTWWASYSGCSAVVVDQSTEDVDAFDPIAQLYGRRGRRHGDAEPEAAVGSAGVVMPQVLGEHVLQMRPAPDQCPI